MRGWFRPLLLHEDEDGGLLLVKGRGAFCDCWLERGELAEGNARFQKPDDSHGGINFELLLLLFLAVRAFTQNGVPKVYPGLCQTRLNRVKKMALTLLPHTYYFVVVVGKRPFRPSLTT